jgi:hypothetical protein
MIFKIIIQFSLMVGDFFAYLIFGMSRNTPRPFPMATRRAEKEEEYGSGIQD